MLLAGLTFLALKESRVSCPRPLSDLLGDRMILPVRISSVNTKMLA